MITKEVENALYDFIVDFDLQEKLLENINNKYVKDQLKEWLGVSQ